MATRAGLLAWLLVTSPMASVGEEPPSIPEIADHGFEVVTLAGESVPVADLLGSGRPVVVEFWATWCAPCQKTFPHLVELKKKHGDAIEVLGLTVEDPEDDRDRVHAFVERHAVNFPVAFAPGELYRLMNRRSDIAVPKLFVFDATGALVAYLPRHSPLTTFKLKSAVSEAMRKRPVQKNS